MRVLHIGPKNYPPAHGGVEKSIFDLARSLVGVQSYVAVEWEHAPASNMLKLPRGIVGRIKAIWSFVETRRIDLLHFNKEAFIPLALFFSAFSRRRVVLTIRGCAWRLSRWPLPIRAAFYCLDLAACALLPAVVFVGWRDYKHFSRLFPWRRFHFIPNGVSEHRNVAKGGAGSFVYVGRISPEKNLVGVINWFKGSRASLTIYGPIDDRNAEYGKEVLAAVDKNPNIRYGGVLRHDELFDELAKYGAFVNCSYSEGMPVSVLEAASVGLSLLLSDIPQHFDLSFPVARYVSPTQEVVSDLIGFGGYAPENRAFAFEKYSLRATCERYEKLYREQS